MNNSTTVWSKPVECTIKLQALMIFTTQLGMLNLEKTMGNAPIWTSYTFWEDQVFFSYSLNYCSNCTIWASFPDTDYSWAWIWLLLNPKSDCVYSTCSFIHGRQIVRWLLRFPKSTVPACSPSYSSKYQSRYQLWRDFEEIIMVPNQLTLKQGENLGGPDLTTWAFSLLYLFIEQVRDLKHEENSKQRRFLFTWKLNGAM